MIRALLLALLLVAPARADAPADWTLTILPEPPEGGAYFGEMIPVRLRGVYGGGIALESLEAPAISGFSWVQLGHDRWADEMVDGLTRRVFERRYAMWPEQAGRLEIPRFEHGLTLIPRPGQRDETAVAAAPAFVDVAPAPVEGRPTPERWLPLSRLDVLEEWSGPTDALAIGEVVTRTVTLLAHGLTPDRMPTTPDIDTDDIFAFAEDEERRVEITPDGPVTTVVWRWSILPDTPEPALIPPLRIAWFDTRAREMRETVLPARRIAVQGAVFGVERRVETLEAAARWARPAGFLGGLAAGIGALALVAWRRGVTARGALDAAAARLGAAAAPWRARLAAWGARRALAAAAARGDAFAARRAARRWAAAQGAVSGAVSDMGAAAAALARFDRLAYGPDAAGAGALAQAAEALLSSDAVAPASGSAGSPRRALSPAK